MKSENNKYSRLKKISIRIGIAFSILFIAFFIYLKISITISPPRIDERYEKKLTRTVSGKEFYTCGNNWLRKSNSGLWEMYVEGNPYEMGSVNGLLASDLLAVQEEAFTSEIKKLIPSGFYRGILKYFVAWYNRNLDKSVGEEYRNEIYGVSKYASEKFSDVGSAYQRFLNYHSAHDVGHALQNMNFTGCTSFAAWDSFSSDSSLLVGRNFDFYVGDEFAKNKIVCFFNPSKGYKFMFISWGGMVGVVSGMNEKGLTVTINSAKSDIPLGAATPVSIVAREILQYSRNIEEAFAIAKKHKTFVSESFLIGSAEDRNAAIIEKSENDIDIYFSKKDYIVCTNHFQGNNFKNEKLNIENIKNSSSDYRYKRVDELITRFDKLNFTNAAEILRDRKGLWDKEIGLGNEKAINQLIAHHSVIFEPEYLLVWVSTNPYQLGEYVAYDLKRVLNDFHGMKKNSEIYEKELTIPIDTFLYSNDYKQFQVYKKLIDELKNNEGEISDKFIKYFTASNPQYFAVYTALADHFFKTKDYKKAEIYYKKALEKEVTTVYEVDYIKASIEKCREKE